MTRNRIGPFRTLRWKITLSYTVVTVGALLFVEVLVLGLGLFAVNRAFRSPLLIRGVEESYGQLMVATLRPYLLQDPPDIAGVQATLDWFIDEEVMQGDVAAIPLAETPGNTTLFVVDAQDTVLALNGPDLSTAIGDSLTGAAPLESPALAMGPLVEAALEAAPLDRRYTIVGSQVLLAIPILDEAGTATLGVLGMVMLLPDVNQEVFRDLLPVAGILLLAFTVGAGLVGSLFGYLTSHGLVHRLDRLATAAGDWSRGTFTTFVHDTHGDELAALAGRMNRMAEQLQHLLAERNRLAVLEERNRIARDLHDSAKQQAFAAAAQLGAARALLTRDVQAAEKSLTEAENLVYALRQELTLLISELRPPELEGRGLGPALEDTAGAWSDRTGIPLTTDVATGLALPPDVEQTLFRIVQEALSNVARHSRATQAHLALTTDEDGTLTLTVVDNGVGFDPGADRAGFGLNSMRQRVRSLPGGSLALASDAESGTRITVTAQLTNGG